ncbi:MAG: hypothetical protein WBL31_14965 [Ilumatobacteraceae bacterium]
MKTEDRSTERGTVSWLVRRYVASRTDITVKAREQYEWAIPHIENGLGAIQLSRLDREDVATWIDGLAAADGWVVAASRSVAPCCERQGAAWSNAKNERSRRVIPLDDDTVRALTRRRAEQAAERLAAGSEWEDNDLIMFDVLQADLRSRWLRRIEARHRPHQPTIRNRPSTPMSYSDGIISDGIIPRHVRAEAE